MDRANIWTSEEGRPGEVDSKQRNKASIGQSKEAVTGKGLVPQGIQNMFPRGLSFKNMQINIH